MTNSQIEKIPLRDFIKTLITRFLVISIVFAPGIGMGQTVQPTVLAPGKDLKPLSDGKNPESQSKSSDFPMWMRAKPLNRPAPPFVPPSAPARTPIKINVEELEKIDSDSVGILTEGQGGFGFEMWEATNRSLIKKLLIKLPVNSPSRTIRALMRRLLLSAARAPSKVSVTEKLSPPLASSVPSKNLEADGELLIMRIERLAAMGDTNAVYNLLKVAPNRATNPILLKHEADVLFLSNDNSRACDLVLGQLGNLDVPYWQKASIYCQALSGNYDQANLGANLLREIGEKDEVFFGLIRALTGIAEYTITSLSKPTPLHFSMIRAAKIKLPTDVTSSDNPAVLKTIATSPNAEVAFRIKMAERAEVIGALDTDVLRQIYAGVTFSQDVLDNAFSQARKERTALSRALLYRKTIIENIPSVKVEILRQVFDLARESGLFQLTARVYYDILKNLAVTGDLVWFAPEAARALLAVGDGAAAKIWFDAIKAIKQDNGEASLLRDKLLPLARLSGLISNAEWDQVKIDDWWNSELESTNKSIEAKYSFHARAILLYNLLEALGDKIPSYRWEALLNSPSPLRKAMPEAALLEILNHATVEGKRAEVVLVALSLFDGLSPSEINPMVLRQVLVSLKEVGLSTEARDLAIEVAIVGGL